MGFAVRTHVALLGKESDCSGMLKCWSRGIIWCTRAMSCSALRVTEICTEVASWSSLSDYTFMRYSRLNVRLRFELLKKKKKNP